MNKAFKYTYSIILLLILVGIVFWIFGKSKDTENVEVVQDVENIEIVQNVQTDENKEERGTKWINST